MFFYARGGYPFIKNFIGPIFTWEPENLPPGIYSIVWII